MTTITLIILAVCISYWLKNYLFYFVYYFPDKTADFVGSMLNSRPAA